MRRNVPQRSRKFCQDANSSNGDPGKVSEAPFPSARVLFLLRQVSVEVMLRALGSIFPSKNDMKFLLTALGVVFRPELYVAVMVLHGGSSRGVGDEFRESRFLNGFAAFRAARRDMRWHVQRVMFLG